MSGANLGGDSPRWAHLIDDKDTAEESIQWDGPTHRRIGDLDSRVEIAGFVTNFYREIAQDERFHRYFGTLAQVDWHAHTLELTDFWSGVLLGEPHEPADQVIEAHRWLHDVDPFDVALFDRWLEIFDTTLDEGWSGPMADAARRRGHGIAWAMAKRLTGHASREPS
jgi:hemoglobin